MSSFSSPLVALCTVSIWILYLRVLGVGTRFVASVEAGAPKMHKDVIVKSTFGDDVRTIIFTGRPLRVKKTPYVDDWYGILHSLHEYRRLISLKGEEQTAGNQGINVQRHFACRTRCLTAPGEIDFRSSVVDGLSGCSECYTVTLRKCKIDSTRNVADQRCSPRKRHCRGYGQ